MIKEPKQLDTSIIVFDPSAYRIARIPPTIGTNQYVYTNSQGYVQFEIPAGVWNPSKLTFQGTITLVPQANANGPLAVTHASYWPYFYRVEVTSAGAGELMGSANIDKYTKASLPLMKDYKARTNMHGCMFSSPRIETSSGTIPPLLADPYITTDNTGSAARFIQLQNIDGPAYYDSDIQNNVVVNTGNYVRNLSVKLSDIFSDSFLSIDKDMYFSSSTYIKYYMSVLNKVGLTVQTTINANTASNLLSATWTNLGMQLYYQMEPNAMKVAMYESEVGFTLMCPLIVNGNANYSGSSQSSTFHLQPNNISPLNRLYKYYYILTLQDNINAGYTAISVTDSSNVYYSGAPQTAVSKLWQIATAQSPNKGQFLILDSGRNEDYALIVNQYDKTSFTSEADYKINGVLAYTFDDQYTMKYYDGNICKGDILPNGSSYDLQHSFTIPVNLTNNLLEHNVFAVFLSPLHFKNGRCSWSQIM
jgi:hypothetical protein